MKPLVISLGGSVIAPKGPDTAFLKKFQALLSAQLKPGKRFIIVCGGGKVCRTYRDAAKKISQSTQNDLDMIGIYATKLNAVLVQTMFRDKAYPRIVQNPTKKIKTTKPVIVASGWRPGFSTDYDAVMLAKTYGSRTILNLSNVDYVYDKDPNTQKGAKPFKKIGWEKFLALVKGPWRPGMHKPFDPIASQKAARLKLRVIVMRGTDIKNLKAYFNNRAFRGTIIGE